MYYFTNQITMKRLVINLFVLLVVCLASSCGLFRAGCDCPKVSYNVYPKR